MQEIEPCNYACKIHPPELICVLAEAHVRRLPSLQEILNRYRHRLGDDIRGGPSTLSEALRRPKYLSLAKWMCDEVCRDAVPIGERNGRLVALDTMPVTVQINQRTDAKKYNHTTRGCGLMWEVDLDAPLGCCPARILKIMHGGWNDSAQVRDRALEPDGPIYLADRGFYCRETLALWLGQNVRFIMRAKKQYLSYDVVKRIAGRKKHGKIQVHEDVIADLKWKGSKQRIRVRLVRGQKGKEDYILVANPDTQETAAELCEFYHRRDRIEKFHKFLKSTLGLGHLYNFQENGLELLIRIVFLMAIALFFNAEKTDGDIVALVQAALKSVRKQLDIPTPWRRNTYAPTRKKKKKRRRKQKLEGGTNH